MKFFLYTIAAWNLIVFLVFGIDKYKAIKGKWRVRESTLILLSLFMGGAGSLLGMILFRHKTKHIKFIILIPLTLIINIVIIYLIWNL